MGVTDLTQSFPATTQLCEVTPKICCCQGQSAMLRECATKLNTNTVNMVVQSVPSRGDQISRVITLTRIEERQELHQHGFMDSQTVDFKTIGDNHVLIVERAEIL